MYVPGMLIVLLRDRSLFMWWGGEGKKSWGGPGLFFLEQRGGPKENFTMIGGGSLCADQSALPEFKYLTVHTSSNNDENGKKRIPDD